jgi:hypothetical protein
MDLNFRDYVPASARFFLEGTIMHTALKCLVATAACMLVATSGSPQSAKDVGGASLLLAATDGMSSPIFGVTIPAGYRQWELIAPSHVPSFDELRAILGNALAMNAYREGTLPFPDGAVLAKLACSPPDRPRRFNS